MDQCLQVTEDVYTKIKKMLPDKKQTAKAKKAAGGHAAVSTATKFATSDATLVQARTPEMSRAANLSQFAQVTVRLDVVEPTRERVQVVLERLLNNEQGRWRICALPQTLPLGPAKEN